MEFSPYLWQRPVMLTVSNSRCPTWRAEVRRRRVIPARLGLEKPTKTQPFPHQNWGGRVSLPFDHQPPSAAVASGYSDRSQPEIGTAAIDSRLVWWCFERVKVLWTVLAFLAALPGAVQAQKVPVTEHLLGNGLRVLLVERH